MARTKRKVNPVMPAVAEPVVQQRIYKAGGYVRLSVEDSGKPGTDTMEAQWELVEGYIESQSDMELIDLYCDNGHTGTNFQRPEFERLMDDVRAGKVDCIVVKDLSRFGRNYKETGNYLERIFPYLDVRFVAVNDSFDTLTAERSQDGYIVPLKNIINEVYSKDISRKVTSALTTKRQNGEFLGSWAPYGYQKSAADKHRLEVNPETAPVVRDIFAWRLSGVAYLQIVRRLNEQGIPCPSRYHYMRGELKSERFANAIWHVPIIKKILADQVYLGHVVSGKTYNDISTGKKLCRIPKEDWLIIRNTHEPLIDENTFQSVQQITEKDRVQFHKRVGKFDELGTTPNILKGLVFCADCKKTMARYKNVSENCGHRYYAFICRTHAENPDSCSNKYLLEDKLLDVLWKCLRQEITLAGNLEKLVEKREKSIKITLQEDKLSRQIVSANQSLSRYKRLHDSLYQNYVDGLMDEREYTEMKRQYRAEMEQSQAKLETLRQQQAALIRQATGNPWLRQFTKFSAATELTGEMAHALIARIEVDSCNHIEITLGHRDEYLQLLELLELPEMGVTA